MHIGSEFILTSLIVAISPGSGALYTIATGLKRGPQASLIAASGCTLGVIPHLLAAVLGLAVVFHTSEFAFNLLKILGALWLLYMALSTLRDQGTLDGSERGDDRPPLKIIGYAIFINLFNPKLSLFFLAFLPQFISSHSSTPTRDMLLLGAIFMLITQGVFMLYGCFSGLMRRRVLQQPRVMRGLQHIFAFSFVALGVRLLFTAR